MNTRTSVALSIACILLAAACKDNKTASNTPGNTKDSLSAVVDSAILKQRTGFTTSAAAASETLVDTSFSQFAFVTHNKYIILSASPDTGWAKGDPYPTTGTNPSVQAAITDINTSALPANYAALLNKPFKVGGRAGKLYTATITNFKLLAIVIPPFGQVQTWNSLPSDAASNKSKARDIRNEGALYLVATFTMDSLSASDELYFAVPATRPIPSFFPFAEKTTATAYKSSIEPLLSKTAAYTTVQKEFETASQKGPWWQGEDGVEEVQAFSMNDQKAYVTICHQGGNACSSNEFFAERFSIWEVPKNTPPHMLYMKDGYYSLLLAVDIDADNIPELLVNSGFGKTELLKFTNGQWTEYYTWIIPYLDCPC